MATHVILFEERNPDGTVGLTFKVGRYWVRNGRVQLGSPVCLSPKSEVRLPPEEFDSLMEFLAEKVPVLRAKVRQYIPIDSESDAESLARIADFLKGADRMAMLRLIEEHGLLEGDVRDAIVNRQRTSAIEEFERMLDQVVEARWQEWFQRNDWLLGSDFVTVLDERRIDTANIADYLVRACDGHLDVVEIKRPRLRFWADQLDHGNLVPHPDLVKAVTQAQAYIFELEREMNSQKALEMFGGCPIAKPRALLIHGRSNGWGQTQFRAQRLFNAGLATVQVLTYDQVLERARRSVARAR